MLSCKFVKKISRSLTLFVLKSVKKMFYNSQIYIYLRHIVNCITLISIHLCIYKLTNKRNCI